MEYCVYLTYYNGNKMPPFYIGSSNVKRILNGYHGSVCSKQYKTIWKEELIHNPELFITKIISRYKTRKEALAKERHFQISLNVVKSEMYINMSIAAPKGYFGRNVKGENNPNFGNTWSDDQRKIASDRSKILHKQGILKSFPILNGKKNGRYNSGTGTFIDTENNIVFTHKSDPRVKSGELKVIMSKPETIQKMRETKLKDKNLKKYSFIILKSPDGEIIKLEWNEYGIFIKENLLWNIISLGRKKGFTLIHKELNLDWTIKIPLGRKSKNLQLTPSNS